ncbi:MAG: hypothetical protein DMF59_12230 [Acidobacteria bacterium]|nr:MAG: hypothetical protein DMF59_12230 [Acidobacteriota bacterium]
MNDFADHRLDRQNGQCHGGGSGNADVVIDSQRHRFDQRRDDHGYPDDEKRRRTEKHRDSFAGERCESDEGQRPAPALHSIPRQRRDRNGAADQRRETVAECQDHPADCSQLDVPVERENQRADCQRIENDSGVIAALVARDALSDEAMQHQPVADRCNRSDRGRDPPRQPLQRDREKAGDDVDRLAQRLVGGVFIHPSSSSLIPLK